MFYFDKIKGKSILKSDLLPVIDAFFTTKDICIKSKDENMQNEVNNNKDIICNYLNIDRKNLITPSQTHTSNIEHASKTKTIYPNTDALILTENDIAIFLNFADCTPIILYDEIKNIGAVVHAGWRGTAQNIVSKTVEKLVHDYKSKAQDITALIGPAIGFCCYNVGEEVLDKLKITVKNFDNLSKFENDKIYVDLKNINKQQLIEAGVKKIDVTDFCTVCDNQYFYSYRKENATTNRHSAILKLR